MSKIGALVRYYFNITLNEWKTMSEDDLLEAWGQLIYVLQKTGQMTK